MRDGLRLLGRLAARLRCDGANDQVAVAVGRKMAALGARHQVVSITHFPQVAATAAHHFVVEKEVVGGRTRSRLYPVTGEARIKELVRMLGGGGEQARAMAASLLETRRLAAILAIDMVGYSRHMQVDEAATLRALREACNVGPWSKNFSTPGCA